MMDTTLHAKSQGPSRRGWSGQ